MLSTKVAVANKTTCFLFFSNIMLKYTPMPAITITGTDITALKIGATQNGGLISEFNQFSQLNPSHMPNKMLTITAIKTKTAQIKALTLNLTFVFFFC